MLEEKRRGGMRFVILDILRDEELHGYGIAEKIEKIYGIEKPSSGLIYPILSKLKDEKLVEVCRRGDRDKKIYHITEKGLRYLEEHREELNDVKSILHNLGEFHRLGGHELMDTMHYLLKQMDEMSDEKKRRISEAIKEFTKKLRFIIDFSDINE